MIQLNPDFSLLNRYFGISPTKIRQYENMDFEEIMKAEAEQGNKKAQEYKKILSDPDKLLEIFQLTSPENKLAILQNMSELDVDKLLPLLSNEQLSKGLEFFNDEKLLTMCVQLPIQELVNMVFEFFETKDILDMMDETAMDKFIVNPDVERKYAQKYFERLDQNALENIMMHSLGEEQEGKSKDEYLRNLEKMSDGDYQRFLLTIERKNKIDMICSMTEQDEKLRNLFDPNDLVNPMTLIMKDDKVKMMKNIKQEFLVPMVKELPLDLTQIVLTQIDPTDFAKVLARDFQNVLGEVVLFAGG